MFYKKSRLLVPLERMGFWAAVADTPRMKFRFAFRF